MNSYVKTVWTDRIRDPQTGEVLEEGTPFMARYANNIEDGIYNAHITLSKYQDDIAKMTLRLLTLEQSFFNNFTSNRFEETFETLDDVIIKNGWYDKVNKRLVI